jgi:hypothetical protein
MQLQTPSPEPFSFKNVVAHVTTEREESGPLSHSRASILHPIFPSTNTMSPTPSVLGTLSESQLIQHARCINEGILIFGAYPLSGLQVLSGLQTEGLLKSILPLVG